MGIDKNFCVKTDKGQFVQIQTYPNNGSRYFGPYNGELYDVGDWPSILHEMLNAVKDNGEIYYGHDHIEPKDYMLVTPELIFQITKMWFEKLKSKVEK